MLCHRGSTLHGATNSVAFAVTAERTVSGIDALADIPIQFSEWNIQNPSVGGFVATANTGTLEVLLAFTKEAGNPPVTGVSGQGAGSAPSGPPSQVTVPSTTVSPLSIPGGS